MFWKEVNSLSVHKPWCVASLSDWSSPVPSSGAAVQTRPDRRRELGDPRGPGLRHPEVWHGPPTHTVLHHRAVWRIHTDQRLVMSDETCSTCARWSEKVTDSSVLWASVLYDCKAAVLLFLTDENWDETQTLKFSSACQIPNWEQPSAVLAGFDFPWWSDESEVWSQRGRVLHCLLMNQIHSYRTKQLSFTADVFISQDRPKLSLFHSSSGALRGDNPPLASTLIIPSECLWYEHSLTESISLFFQVLGSDY